ncbi:MAG: 1,4-dihydroxy-2-naphthoate polyprenyltransferase [Gemmatimonadetes bacterium]|nr:1,4-dihydroxy-2-naphthoate polyprenyltransferase [Gemmatimonadota bacterium]
MATRPRTLSAAAAPVVAATGFAFADRALAALPALAALLGALLIQIATNLANDYYDYLKGGDTGERLGPVRVTSAGILPPRAVQRGMYVALALATLTGAYLVAVAGWPILAIGLASMLMGVCYTGGPYPLSYHGLGDAFVFVFFGPVATLGTYYVQARQWSVDALLVGVGLGAFSTAMLVVNNLRDRETDEAAGKRTLAVRFGDVFSVVQYFAALTAAGIVPVIGLVAMGWSPWTLLSLAGLAACLPAEVRVLAVLRAPARVDRRTLNPALGTTARGVALYGLGLGVGATISGLVG